MKAFGSHTADLATDPRAVMCPCGQLKYPGQLHAHEMEPFGTGLMGGKDMLETKELDEDGHERNVK
jgi:hypothetical protein